MTEQERDLTAKAGTGLGGYEERASSLTLQIRLRVSPTARARQPLQPTN